MSVRVVLQPSALAVVAGNEGRVEVAVHNTGSVVDAYRVEIVGDAGPWATVEPATLNLYPGADATAVITFRPPQRADVAAGSVPFGVRVVSQESPDASVTEEGVVEVRPFVSVALDVVPRTSKGRRSAEHALVVANHGNAPTPVELAASDPDDHLAFSVEPASAVVGAGEVLEAKLRVRMATKHRSGPPLTRPFQVVVTSPDGQSHAVAPAMVVQNPQRPAWLKRAVLWSVIGLIALVALWLGLLKPTVESAAREAVAPDETPVTIGPGGAGSGGGAGGDDGASDSSSGGDGDASTSPIDGRLFLTASGTTDFTVPEGKSLHLTDIVLQNPLGNTGALRIQRGDTALLVVELANFRDLDYHFVAPIVFTSGQRLVLFADCTSPGCAPGAYFAGYLVG